MALSKEAKQIVKYRDLFIESFWRSLLASLWLFFPPILFLFLIYSIFWHITQGKDLMVITLQKTTGFATISVFTFFIVALIFYVYITWYSTRLVAKGRDFQYPKKHNMDKVFLDQSPRILAFTCITLILLGFFQLGTPMYPDIPGWVAHILLLLSFPWYWVIYTYWTRFLQQKDRTRENWLHFLKRVRTMTYRVLIAWFILAVALNNFASLISLLLALQAGLVLLLILGREITIEKSDAVSVTNPNPHGITPQSRIWKKIKHMVTDEEDKLYFRGFNIISSLAVVVYVAAIVFIQFAVFLGSLPVLLLAFGVLLGIGNFITLISVFARFNFHLLFFMLAFLIGHFVDPHYATVVEGKKGEPSVSFKERKDLRQYFKDWLNDSNRRKAIDSSSAYPVYFVMANGGASRSGYWVASILAKLEDTTKGDFSKHLFCLSGASGGSVGTATFFSLLRAKESLKARKISNIDAATSFLSSDFLTYTLARMLGPDVIRNIIPLWFINDRAAALAYAIERAPGKSNFLYDSFSVRFSQIMTRTKQKEYLLPILCINTTRMQDGRPGVISNIRLDEDDKFFNGRLDVLSMLRDSGDMKLSTAVVLGASFPYVSPAGRINNKHRKEKLGVSNYFVDGGYFDNSGAGIVNEMIIGIENMIDNDSLLRPYMRYLEKLKFYVIHITNTDKKILQTGRINPITNDVLAPIKTMLGSYGTQTIVNDLRLKNYLWNLYDNDDHYYNIELYPDSTRFKYSMNWVISRYQLNSMTQTLPDNPGYKRVIERLRKDSLVKE